MSLFHKTEENAGSAIFTDKESVLAILFLAVTADGNISPEEEELVITASNRMKLLRGLGVADFNAAVQKVRDAIDGQGRAEVLAAAIKALPEGLGDTVYALAADIVFADGTAQPVEIEFLREVQESLSVQDEFATKALEVMRIKNHG